jgi:hypothetical protein
VFLLFEFKPASVQIVVVGTAAFETGNAIEIQSVHRNMKGAVLVPCAMIKRGRQQQNVVVVVVVVVALDLALALALALAHALSLALAHALALDVALALALALAVTVTVTVTVKGYLARRIFGRTLPGGPTPGTMGRTGAGVTINGRHCLGYYYGSLSVVAAVMLFLLYFCCCPYSVRFGLSFFFSDVSAGRKLYIVHTVPEIKKDDRTGQIEVFEWK